MQFAVTFRHMEPTEALKSYARERMERVRKYLPDPISCHVVLSTEPLMSARAMVSRRRMPPDSVAIGASARSLSSTNEKV